VLPLTDTHCHLNYDSLINDIDDVLNAAWNQGIKKILVPGTDLATSNEAIELSEKDSRLFAAVGFHPNDANGWNDDSIKKLDHLARHPKVLAIGEIGLDYYRDYTPKPIQKEMFIKQLKLALNHQLPVVIHNRDADDDIMELLSQYASELRKIGSPLEKRPGVLHSFSGDYNMAMEAIKHHFYIGISGPVTYKNAQDKQSLVQRLPLESILIETDAPFLAPHPKRGRRNQPSYVHYVLEKIAELKNISPMHAAEITAQNAAELFQWN
jgi:TatD DNase family protein